MIRPLFKVHEPFMEVTRGHGYLGVVMYDDVEDKVQCHICGKWTKMLAQHSRMAHGIKSADYRERFSLPLRGGMMSKSSASKFSDRASTDDMIRKLSDMRSKSSSRIGRVANARRKSTRRSRIMLAAKGRLSSKNRIGLCPAQMQARFDVVRLIAKRNPSNLDIHEYDRKLYDAMRRFGSVDKWRKANGIELFPKKSQNKYENLDVIAKLRKMAHKIGKEPSIAEWDESGQKPYSSTIRRRFGSWRDALVSAGLI